MMILSPKKLGAALALTLALGASAQTANTQVSSLLFQATTQAAGTAARGVGVAKTYQAWGTTSSGSGSATINIECSNNLGTSWDVLGTITLTLSTSVASNSFQSSDHCNQVRGNVTAISGTGASVNAAMSY